MGRDPSDLTPTLHALPRARTKSILVSFHHTSRNLLVFYPGSTPVLDCLVRRKASVSQNPRLLAEEYVLAQSLRKEEESNKYRKSAKIPHIPTLNFR